MGRSPQSDAIEQSEVADLPDRVGNRHAFVYERVLVLIARETVRCGSATFVKGDLARSLGCCKRSLDRALARLRRAGLVISTPRFGEHGAQLGNDYQATALGISRAFALVSRRS